MSWNPIRCASQPAVDLLAGPDGKAAWLLSLTQLVKVLATAEEMDLKIGSNAIYHRNRCVL